MVLVTVWSLPVCKCVRYDLIKIKGQLSMYAIKESRKHKWIIPSWWGFVSLISSSCQTCRLPQEYYIITNAITSSSLPLCMCLNDDWLLYEAFCVWMLLLMTCKCVCKLHVCISALAIYCFIPKAYFQTNPQKWHFRGYCSSVGVCWFKPAEPGNVSEATPEALNWHIPAHSSILYIKQLQHVYTLIRYYAIVY